MHFFLIFAALLFTTQGASADEKCPPRQHWVRPHNRRAYTRGDGTQVKAAEVVGHCQRNSSDYHVWNQKLKNGRPKPWAFSKEKSVDWTTEDRERVLEALQETPSFLKDLNIDAIYRMIESVTPGNPASTLGLNIVLYNNAFDSDHNLTHVLDHEMAHQFLEGLSPRETKSFLDAAGWRGKRINGTLTYLPGRPAKQFLRPNGRLSYREDFADDVTAFIHEPARLKATSPGVFAWMERHLKPRLGQGVKK